MPHMSAVLLLDERVEMPDGAVVEIVIWRLPRSSPDRPHGLKYRLFFGHGGKCLVRYDNEAGKGDHKHVGVSEKPYRFVSVRKLSEDFWTDVMRAPL